MSDARLLNSPGREGERIRQELGKISRSAAHAPGWPPSRKGIHFRGRGPKNGSVNLHSTCARKWAETMGHTVIREKLSEEWQIGNMAGEGHEKGQGTPKSGGP